jgi:hypothetical protein
MTRSSKAGGCPRWRCGSKQDAQGRVACPDPACSWVHTPGHFRTLWVRFEIAPCSDLPFNRLAAAFIRFLTSSVGGDCSHYRDLNP